MKHIVVFPFLIIFSFLFVSCKSDSSFVGHWVDSRNQQINIAKQGSIIIVDLTDRYPNHFTAQYTNGLLVVDARNVQSPNMSISDNEKSLYFEGREYKKQ